MQDLYFSSRQMPASTSARSAPASHRIVPVYKLLQRRPVSRRVAPILNYASASVPAKIVEKLNEEVDLLPLPRATEGLVDDISLHNPLQRSQRLSTGWFGVIMEYEGVIVEETNEAHVQAWQKVAAEFGYPKPLGHLFRRIKGIRDEVVVTRVFNWTQNPSVARQIASRKREIYDEQLGGRKPAELEDARSFLQMLNKYSIPTALACALPETRVKEGLGRLGLQSYFDAIVTAEDSGAPEVEYYYMFAAQQIERPPLRCIVVGESNTSVEAAHELGMKCVVVTGNNPVYNYVGADLVVRNLGQLSFINLKKLFGQEDLVEPKDPLEPEAELLPEDFEDEFQFEEAPVLGGASRSYCS